MIWLIILIEIGMFIAGVYLLNKYDKEAGIQVSKKEYVIMGLIFAMTEIVLFSFYGYGREFYCHSLSLYYLIFAAYIDYKTRMVYRIGSVAYILFAIVLFVFIRNRSLYEIVERTICILLFSTITFMQGTLGWMGWGDVLTYIGVFFFLGSWEYSCSTLELMAFYILLANILFFFLNIRNFDWKRKLMKKHAAFLPEMAGATVILEFLRMLN